MDLTNKKTALDDSADIYQEREAKTQRERWKEMKTFQQSHQQSPSQIRLSMLLNEPGT